MFMAFNTGNAVGSNDPRDLSDNAAVIDQVANSQENLAFDRLGRPVLTLAGIGNAAASEGPAVEAAVEAARQAGLAAVAAQGAAAEVIAGVEGAVELAQGAAADAQTHADEAAEQAGVATDAAAVASAQGKIYQTTAAGLSATAVDGYFYVPNSEGSLILYQNVANAAVEKGSIASQSMISKIDGDLPFDYFVNRFINGDFSEEASWTYTGTSPLISTDAITPLASLGIKRGYSFPTAGGTAHQIRSNSANWNMGEFLVGQTLLVGGFLYSQNGEWPADVNGGGYYTEDSPNTLIGFTSTGQIVFGANLRFYWASAVPASKPTRFIYGWTAARITTATGQRVQGGIFAGHSGESLIASDARKYSGWKGQVGRAATFDALEQVAVKYLNGDLDGGGEAGAAGAALHLGGVGQAESYIEVVRSGSRIRRSFVPFRSANRAASNVFDFTRDEVDGFTVKSMSDDVAPYRVEGATIGANHGYFRHTVTGTHGKTTADLGSVYSSGGAELVVVEIVDSNTIRMLRRDSVSSASLPAGTYTRVSGGSNTANFSGSASVVSQLYPPFQSYSMRVFVDGLEVSQRSADLNYKKSVSFVEYYEVMSLANVAAWYVASGTGGGFIPSGQAMFAVSVSYTFDIDGNCTIHSDFTPLSNFTVQDIMFLQAQKVTTDDGVVNYYIPKALPITHEGVTYNYALKASADTSSWSGRLDVKPSDAVATGILADRLIQLTSRFGFAMGYLPRESAGADRRANATVKAMQISNSGGKVYLSAVDKGSHAVSQGDFYSVTGYRNVLVNNPVRTDAYPVRSANADYFYADWHSTVRDCVPLPDDFIGRDFEVVEKSDNVTVLSRVAGGGIQVQVNAAGSYGYLILKFDK